MEKSSRVCAFCSSPIGGQKSNEHVFPQWLLNYLGIKDTQVHRAEYSIEGKLSKHQTFTLHGLVTSHVCKECNGGWLSKMEKTSQSVIKPLVNGTFQGVLEKKERAVIANWAFKTSLVLELASPLRSLVPKEHYHYLYNQREIAARVLIAMGAINVRGPDDLFWIRNGGWPGGAIKVGDEKLREYLSRAYKITFRAGSVAWRVSYFPSENIPAITLYEYREDAIRHIYPKSSQNFNWPPYTSLEDLHEMDRSLVFQDNLHL